MELLDLPTEILEQILSYNLCFKKDWCADPYRSKFLARRRVCRTFDIIVSRFTIPLLDLNYLLHNSHWTWSVESITWVLATSVAIHRDEKSPLLVMIRRVADAVGQVIEEWENDTSQGQSRSKSSHFMMDLWKEVSGAVVINQGVPAVIRKLLLQSGTAPSWLVGIKDSEEDVRRPVDDGDILSILAWYGDPAIVRWFMAGRQVDPNIKNDFFGLPLYVAAAAGHTEIVSFLLEKNANVNEEGGFWHTPLLAAIRHNASPGIIDPLVNAGADLSFQNPRTNKPFLTAAVGEEAEKIAKKVLHPFYADYTLQDAWGRTLANHAGDKGLITLVRGLLGNEAVDARCQDSTTPLHFAICCIHTDVSQVILNEDLDVRALQKRDNESSDSDRDPGEVSG